MIKSQGIKIWTNRGWLPAEGLMVGDKVISYNPKRNCTEYDTVRHIQTEYKTQHFQTLTFKGMRLTLTKDHPVITYNRAKNISVRKTMDEVFMTKFQTRSDSILYNSWFEPYDITIDHDDLLWSARLASSFSLTKTMPGEYREQIWNVIENINGYQAQIWMDECLSWNRQFYTGIWMKAIRLSNRDLRAMIFHVGVKAGVGLKFRAPPGNRVNKTWLMCMSSIAPATPAPPASYSQSRETTHSFNIATRNGSFMADYRAGTFLIACDIKEDI